MADRPHRPNPKPIRQKGLLQRVELQQAPAMAARPVRQDRLHRRRFPRPQQSGLTFLLPPALGRRKRQGFVQLRGHGHRALQLFVQSPQREKLRVRVVQWRRPRVSQRGLHVVASAAQKGQ